jgi:hypothetical protein
VNISVPANTERKMNNAMNNHYQHFEY